MNYQDIFSYSSDLLVGIGIFLFVVLEIYVVNRLARFFKNKAGKFNYKSLKIFNLEILDTGKQQLIINAIINLIQAFVILSAIYFTLVLALSALPATADIAQQLIDFIFIPLQNISEDVVSYLPDFFNIIVTIIVFRYLTKALKYLTQEVVAGRLSIPGFEARTAQTTASIIRALLFILMIIIILPSMPGYESLAFKGIVTFLGALITIGGSSVIANYMAGLVLTYMHAFDKGDWIEIDGVMGEVQSVGPFAIRLLSTKKEDISIPHSKILGSHIKNYSGENKDVLILHTEVSIGYDVSWQQVNELLLQAAERTELVNMSKAPFVFQKKLDDFYIVYELNAYLSDPSKMSLGYSELHKHILDVFNEADIEIMSPHYLAKRDGSDSTIPAG